MGARPGRPTRPVVAIALLVGALALAGCATTDGSAASGDPAATAEARTTPDAMGGETGAPEPSADPADVDATDAAPAPAQGAYLDFEDGAIEATPGAKALFFHATWCPKCRALDEDLRAQGAPDGLTVFKVDYDARTDLRQQYGVTIQTTIVFVDDAGEKISSVVLYEDPSVASLEAAIP